MLAAGNVCEGLARPTRVFSLGRQRRVGRKGARCKGAGPARPGQVSALAAAVPRLYRGYRLACFELLQLEMSSILLKMILPALSLCVLSVV